MTLIFHIASRNAALAARQTGEYRPESLAREGLIHFSDMHQVLDVADHFYTGQRGWVLLAVDVSRLKAELKYEAPLHPAAVHSVALPENEDFPRDKRLKDSNHLTDKAAPDLFPHLYGPLNFDAVVAIYDLEPNSIGKFSLPAELLSTL